MKVIALPPIQEGTETWERMERRIKELFKRNLYYPMLRILGQNQNTIKNSGDSDDLEQAIMLGKVYYANSVGFKGKFNAKISKQLREIGAVWDNKNKSYKIQFVKIPISIRAALSVSKARFDEKLEVMDRFLTKVDSKEFSSKLKTSDLFDKELFNVDKKFRANVKKITVEPELNEDQRKVISKEWETNMDLWVQKFTEEQIVKLRKIVADNVYAGNRQEALHAPIERMLLSINKEWPNVANKAKFLARQETHLLLAKFKQVRYEEVGITHYRWACVKRPHQPTPTAPYVPHEVRYSHGILEGKTFKWSDPPVTTSPLDKRQRRNNPGQDFNCRCFAIPLLKAPDKP